MILEFRTERNRNGNCHYLAMDTGAEVYSTSPRGWITKDICKISVRNYREMIQSLKNCEWKRHDEPIC